MAADPEPDDLYWGRRLRRVSEGEREVEEPAPRSGKRHHGWRRIAPLRHRFERGGGSLGPGHQIAKPGPDQNDSGALCEKARKVRRKIEDGPLAMDANPITL